MEAYKTFRQFFVAKNATLKDAEKKIEYWYKKKNIGIIAKLAQSRGHELRLTNSKTAPKTKDKKFEVFREILRSKYTLNSDLREVLLSTKGKNLIEFSRSAKRREEKGQDPERWAGYFDTQTGRQFGQNWMGELHMQIRDEFLKANTEVKN